jgi:hypothetical protein
MNELNVLAVIDEAGEAQKLLGNLHVGENARMAGATLARLDEAAYYLNGLLIDAGPGEVEFLGPRYQALRGHQKDFRAALAKFGES